MRVLTSDPPPAEIEALIELLIVGPETRKIDWLGLRDGGYEPIGRSSLIDLDAEQLSELINWPPLG